MKNLQRQAAFDQKYDAIVMEKSQAEVPGAVLEALEDKHQEELEDLLLQLYEQKAEELSNLLLALVEEKANGANTIARNFN